MHGSIGRGARERTEQQTREQNNLGVEEWRLVGMEINWSGAVVFRFLVCVLRGRNGSGEFKLGCQVYVISIQGIGKVTETTFTHSRVFTETNISAPPFSKITSYTQHRFQKSFCLHEPA